MGDTWVCPCSSLALAGGGRGRAWVEPVLFLAPYLPARPSGASRGAAPGAT